VIGAVSFSATGTGGCTQINSRTIRCTSGITSFRISYRYQMQVFASEDGTEEFSYQSTFARQAGLTNARYDLFFPPSWTVLIIAPAPNFKESGHFQWVRQNINSFVAQVRFQIRPDCRDQVQVKSFSAVVNSGLKAIIQGNVLSLLTNNQAVPGIAFTAVVNINTGAIPVDDIRIH
jgi:hypothetical protein